MWTTRLVLSTLLFYSMKRCKATDSVRSRPKGTLPNKDRSSQSDGLELLEEKKPFKDRNSQIVGLELVEEQTMGVSVKQAHKGRLHPNNDNVGDLVRKDFEKKKILLVWNKFILQMIRK